MVQESRVEPSESHSVPLSTADRIALLQGDLLALQKRLESIKQRRKEQAALCGWRIE